MNDPIVIVGAARTPMGAFQGDFSSLTASDLGAVAIKAAVERAGLKPEQVDAVLFGNVLQAGQGQAPARQAAIKAGLPVSATAATISKVCGSAMQATMFAFDALLAGTNEVVVAGGMESMTNAPYLVPKAPPNTISAALTRMRLPLSLLILCRFHPFSAPSNGKSRR